MLENVYKIGHSVNAAFFFLDMSLQVKDKKNTYKSGRVVVPHSFGISKSFQNRICLDNLILKIPSFNAPVLVLVGADGGEVGDHLLRVLSLSGSRFSPVKIFEEKKFIFLSYKCLLFCLQFDPGCFGVVKFLILYQSDYRQGPQGDLGQVVAVNKMIC